MELVFYKVNTKIDKNYRIWEDLKEIFYDIFYIILFLFALIYKLLIEKLEIEIKLNSFF